MATNQIQQQQTSIYQKGMKAEVYRAANNGSFEEMCCISDWKEQETPTKNNILHIHVGKVVKPFQERPKDHEKELIDEEFLEKVLIDDEGYSLLWKSNSNGCTPLHLAARLGHEIAVQVFLIRASKVNGEEVTKLMQMTNNKKDTALHEAARAGHATVVELLVSKDPNCEHHEPNDDGETPLYLAAERGSTTSVLNILENCNAPPLAYHCKGPCGRTILHAAVQWGEREMVRKIVEKDRSLIRIQNDEGLTPIHCASAELQKVALLKILLEEDSSAVYIQDNMGRTPLHIAMLRKNWKAIESLIESCPDCIEIVDYKGQNVLHYAAKWTCAIIMKRILKQQHVDKLVNEKDMDGNTPLHILASSLSDIPFLHTCLRNSLRSLIKNMPSLDLKAFNKQNRTVGDILFSMDSLLRRERKLEAHKYNMLPRGRRINTYEGDFDVERANSDDIWNAELTKKTAESRLVVAALIATVSFTAGFTIPGGFDQNQGKTMGMAVLKSKASFQAFLISDIISFTTSALAILLYFMLPAVKSHSAIRSASLWARVLTTISLGALMVAFTTGVSAVLPKSSGLVTFNYIASTVFFFRYFLAVRGACRALKQTSKPFYAYKNDRLHL